MPLLKYLWRRMAARQPHIIKHCKRRYTYSHHTHMHPRLYLYRRPLIHHTSKRPFSATILPYKGVAPVISPHAFIASTSSIIGDVRIEEDASIWFNCVLRGDVASIRVGKRSNVQDGTVIHVNSAKPDLNIPQLHTLIGEDVTVGHGCILHACQLHDRSFIGMQACIMDGAIIESDAMVAAGALVTMGKVVKSGELWAGRPAKLLKKLEPSDLDEILASAQRYVAWSKDYL
mmetsp:Transcript_57664/g.91669  ORF Transcript_57664/g.91669 Transcript_57664/m.91669 type:complete len:231 (+) Transcript_57664:804-1496(+)